MTRVPNILKPYFKSLRVQYMALLFNIYVNDLPDKVRDNVVQYPDDTTIYKSIKPNKLHRAGNEINNSLKSLKEWSDNNDLALNALKTKVILFSSETLSKKHDLHDIHLRAF